MSVNAAAPAPRGDTSKAPARQPRQTPALFGGFAALAEAAWMGFAQATEVLEPARAAALRLLGGRARARDGEVAGTQRAGRLADLFTGSLTIAQATVMLMASFFLSALLGAVRQVLFNAQFGAGADANAFYAAIRLPDTLFSLIAGGALSNAMIPVLLSTARDDGEGAAQRLSNLVLTTLLAVFAVIVLLGELFTPAFVTGILAPGFDARTADLTINLTRIMLAQPLILAGGSVAIAVLNSRNQFFLTALSIASHNIALIGGILASAANPGLGIYGPTFGVVGGAVLQVLILLPGLSSRSFRFRPAWALADRRLREVVKLLIPNGLAVGVGYAGFILDTAFASGASEERGLAALHNSWMLVGLPVALLGQAVGHAAFPRLAAHAAASEWGPLRSTLVRSLAITVGLAVPALVGLLVLGRPVIRVLFEHGKFDAAAGSLTFDTLVAYAVGLPAYVGTEVVVRGLIALRDTRTPLLTNSVQLVARAAIIFLLISRLGVVAIPLAFAVAASAEMVALAAILLSRVGRRLKAEPSLSYESDFAP